MNLLPDGRVLPVDFICICSLEHITHLRALRRYNLVMMGGGRQTVFCQQTRLAFRCMRLVDQLFGQRDIRSQGMLCMPHAPIIRCALIASA